MMAITLINSIVISRVDYCNSLLVDRSSSQITWIQAAFNDAARLIFGLSRRDHVTPILHDCLHWLHAQQCIAFKVVLLVYKALDNLAPDYIVVSVNQVAATNVDPHFGLQMRASSSYLRLWPRLANDHLLLLYLICETICHGMFDNRHRSTSLREDLKHFCLISLLGTTIMYIAFGLGYVTALYKLSLLLFLLLLHRIVWHASPAVLKWVELNLLLHIIKGDSWRQVEDCRLGLYHQKSKTHEPPRAACEVVRASRNHERSSSTSSPSSTVSINYFQKLTRRLWTIVYI